MLTYYCNTRVKLSPHKNGTLVIKRWWSQKDKFRKFLDVRNIHKHRESHSSFYKDFRTSRIFIQFINNNFAVIKSILYWLGEVVYSLISLCFPKLMFFFICYSFSLYSSQGWPWYSYLRFSYCRIVRIYLTEITVN